MPAVLQIFPGVSSMLFEPSDETGELKIKNIIYSDISIKDSTFENNSVTNDKPSDIYSNYFVDDQGTVTAAEEGYTTIPKGGAMYVSGNLTVKNSTFKNNIAKANNKGTTYNYKGNGEVEQVDYNYDDGYGGAISHGGENLIIENSSFEGNVAGGEGGGAISAGSTIANITNSTFTSNSTTGSGGAINFAYGQSLNIKDTDFTNNTAKQGGAINAEYKNNMAPVPTVTVTALNKDVKFSGNTAEKGGDIYIADGTLNLNANQGKEISFNGGIVGKNAVININDASINSLYENLSSVGKIVVDNFVSPDENSALAVNLKAGTLALTKDNYLDKTDLTLEVGSLLDLANNNVGGMNLNSLTSNNANLKN